MPTSTISRCRPPSRRRFAPSLLSTALFAVSLLGVHVVFCAPAGAVGDSGVPLGSPRAPAPDAPARYSPPLDRPVVDPFRMDAGEYGPGNRGLQYASVVGDEVHAIGSGVVRFAGQVAGRSAVTVLHPDGRRSSLTGLLSISVRQGEVVMRGQVLGLAATGLHLGVREGERYVDPAALFASRRRAVLVPLGATPRA